MSGTVPTVRIKSDTAPGGHVVINLEDLRPEHEVVDGDRVPDLGARDSQITERILAKIFCRRSGISWQDWLALPAEERGRQLQEAEREIDNAPSPDDARPRVAKGPGGRIYLKRGKETIAGPFETEGEAEAALLTVE